MIVIIFQKYKKIFEFNLQWWKFHQSVNQHCDDAKHVVQINRAFEVHSIDEYV
jgi:hypothetical protein